MTNTRALVDACNDYIAHINKTLGLQKLAPAEREKTEMQMIQILTLYLKDVCAKAHISSVDLSQATTLSELGPIVNAVETPVVTMPDTTRSALDGLPSTIQAKILLSRLFDAVRSLENTTKKALGVGDKRKIFGLMKRDFIAEVRDLIETNEEENLAGAYKLLEIAELLLDYRRGRVTEKKLLGGDVTSTVLRNHLLKALEDYKNYKPAISDITIHWRNVSRIATAHQESAPTTPPTASSTTAVIRMMQSDGAPVEEFSADVPPATSSSSAATTGRRDPHFVELTTAVSIFASTGSVKGIVGAARSFRDREKQKLYR